MLLKSLPISYVFFAEVIGKPVEINFEQSEIDEGFKLEWVLAGEILDVLDKDRPLNYEGSIFICKRDKAIINYYYERILDFELSA